MAINILAVEDSLHAATDSTTLVILGAFTLVGTIISAYMAHLSNKHARGAKQQVAEVNDAVNHRKPNQDRLYTMVDKIQAQLTNIGKRLDWHVETTQAFHTEVISFIETVDSNLNKLEDVVRTDLIVAKVRLLDHMAREDDSQEETDQQESKETSQ